MQAVPTRYVSVSELYSTDEVELLLDEIRELEPTSCRGEDVQDFEIAGSGGDGCGGGGGGGGGAASPAGTELTARSWDSHAQYLREPPHPPQPLAPLYCRPGYLLTRQGLCTLIILVCSACAGACVWAGVGGVRLGGGGAGAGALRALQLGALTAALLHAALLLLHLTALHRLMPLDWDALRAACGLWAAGWQLGSAALLLQAVLLHHAQAPPTTRDLFFAAIGLSCVSGSVGLVEAARWSRVRLRRARARARARAAAPSRGSYTPVPPEPDLHEPL